MSCSSMAVNEKQKLAQSQGQERAAQPEDYDKIDYTSALLREQQRRLRSQEIFHGHIPDDNRVRNHYIRDEEYQYLGPKVNNEVWFDVLPSFEMIQSLQSSAGAGDFTEKPPNYPTDSDDIIPVQRPELQTMETHRSQILSATTSNTDLPSHRPSLSSASSNIDTGVSDQNIIDNVHKLPRMPTNPLVTIDIHVTKTVPHPHVKSEDESMLKEFTSGDVVHGYVIIQNNSSEDVDFHMFYVTLEGVVAIADPAEKMVYSRKFLNMIDLSASWSYGNISPSANVHYAPGEIDWDGSRLGLRKYRVLQPGIKYKKYFTFKMPYNLLDNTCRHGQELHTLLPPSLGINRYAKRGKYSHIEINEALHYGHMGTRGSPVLTDDVSNGKLSVNYSINATLLGLHPTLKDAVGQPLLAVMVEQDYALRFIPFGFGVSLFSSKDALVRLKGSIESTFKTAERELLMTMEGKEEQVRQLDNEIKQQQISLHNLSLNGSGPDMTSFPLRNERGSNRDFSKVVTTLHYVPSSLKKTFSFGKSSLTSTNSGIITLSTKVPRHGLPYVSPPMLREINEVSKLTELNLANYDRMNNVLSQNEKKSLTHLDFELTFVPSDMAAQSSASPPQISHISAKLLVVNAFSKSSIPVKISSDLFMDDGERFRELKADFAKYSADFEKLAQKFKAHGLDIGRYVERSITDDIKAMNDLQAETSLHDVFKTKTNTNTNDKWERSGNEWKRKVHVDLELLDDVKETLVPNFQNCLLSRIYCIQVDFKFKHCSKMGSVKVPIRFRWFE